MRTCTVIAARRSMLQLLCGTRRPAALTEAAGRTTLAMPSYAALLDIATGMPGKPSRHGGLLTRAPIERRPREAQACMTGSVLRIKKQPGLLIRADVPVRTELRLGRSSRSR